MQDAPSRGSLMESIQRLFPVARSGQIKTEPVPIRWCGIDVVLFRPYSEKTAGAARTPIGCLTDVCPHRGAALSNGRCVEEGLECAEHGWRFDVDGRCVAAPMSPIDNTHAKGVQSYRVREIFGWVFVTRTRGRAKNFR